MVFLYAGISQHQNKAHQSSKRKASSSRRMWSAPGALSASIAAAGASNASSRIPDPWLHIEDTHINDSAKLVTLPGIVTLAVTWAHRCATRVMGRKPIRRKTHKRLKKSWFRTGFDALRRWIIYDPDDALMAWQTTIPKGPVKLPEIQCGVYCGRNGYLCAFRAGKPPNKSCDDALWLSFKVSAGPGSGSTGSGSPRRTCVINPLFVLTVRPVSSAARPLCRLTWMQRFLRVTLSGPLSGRAPCTSSYGCQTPRQPTREHKGRRPVSESED